VKLQVRVLALLLAIATMPDVQARTVLTVSAAISLTDALEEAGRLYRTSGGGDVRFNFAGSNVLARQILNGAPVDVFVSADMEQMRLVEAAGRVASGTRIELLRNHLAVVLSGSAPSIWDVEGLTRPAIRRVALGDPDGVPAGVYARQYLQAAGVWDRISPKVVPVASVRAALTAAAAGHVDAAFVYRSDISSRGGARVAFVVSGPNAPAIVYPAAAVTGSRNAAAAARFLAFLRGPEARAIFNRYGFEALPAR
jgi:molybdate transport system substrate-binding protein